MSKNDMTQQLIDQGESATVELVSVVDNSERIAKAVAAFLNTKGGTVIVGVDEDKKQSNPITKQDLTRLEKSLRDQVTPSTLFAVSLDETDVGNVIVIEVPKGADRPYVIKGTVFVRHGSQVRAATAENIRQMVEADTDRPRWERRIATGLRLDDLNSELIIRTAKSAVNARGIRFEDPADEVTVLNELSMMQFGDLTNAADVSFGLRVSGRQPQTRMRAVCYETDRAGERFLDEQLFEGPALSIFDAAMAFLSRNVSVTSTFRPSESRRDSRPKYPFNSLREGLVNALAHRDYESYSGGASISVYPNRIEIWNSGELAVSPQKLAMAKHESILVNPDISHVFYLNGLMERVGRGTYAIVRECKEFEMRAPKWQNTDSGVRLTLFAASSVVSAVDELSERVLSLLTSLKSGETISLSEYLDRFPEENLSERQARRDLKELTDLGFLERFGSARSTRYKRTEVGLP